MVMSLLIVPAVTGSLLARRLAGIMAATVAVALAAIAVASTCPSTSDQFPCPCPLYDITTTGTASILRTPFGQFTSPSLVC